MQPLAANHIPSSSDAVCWLKSAQLLSFSFLQNYDQEIGYLGIATIGVSFITMIGVGRLLDWTNAF